MKIRLIQILAIFLTLAMVNIGFARSEFLLCQTKCDYLQQDNTDLPPCCRDKVHMTGTMSPTGDHDPTAENCPHLKTSKKVTGSLAFMTGLNKLPAPDKYPAFTGTIAFTVNQMSGPARRNLSLLSSGLSPPGTTPQPLYHLNCSLLI